jgi:alkylated DNA repair dioxygenase AlkB
MMQGRVRGAQQGELFAVRPHSPHGFEYQEHVILPAEERDLAARFESLPLKPFDFHGWLGKRRVVSFGWRYDYGGRTLRESDAIPSFLLPLRERAAAVAGVAAEDLRQILVTEYAPGAGIGWHRDKPMFEDVVAVSFLAACVLRFRRRAADGWERAAMTLAPRSAYLLRGPSRREWEHSIPAVPQLRYSVTFRNFVPGDARGQEEAP